MRPALAAHKIYKAMLITGHLRACSARRPHPYHIPRRNRDATATRETTDDGLSIHNLCTVRCAKSAHSSRAAVATILCSVMYGVDEMLIRTRTVFVRLGLREYIIH